MKVVLAWDVRRGCNECLLDGSVLDEGMLDGSVVDKGVLGEGVLDEGAMRGI